MSYLLDTNVISELVRKSPDRQVLAWFKNVPDSALHLSVLTIGEIRHGVERMVKGQKREKLRMWLELELPAWFEERILPVSLAVAERWGRLIAEQKGSVPAVDSLLAATALHNELRLVTRNDKNFAFPGLDVVNPWSRV